MLPHWATVDIGVMAMKKYSAFSKAPALLEHHYLIVISTIPVVRESNPSVEMQSVCSTAPADWANKFG